MENVLLATEIVKDYHKEDISPRCAMMIDISKAFDLVQWPFLLNTLRAMGLPEKFLKWITLCVTTASFSVQVNGELAGYFQSSRGLRQGCSLSPYLFVICMNVLSKLLDEAAAKGQTGFHPKCKNIALTHLCFADDLLVFADGSQRSVEGILQVFEAFDKMSGLKISLEKSTLFLAGVGEQKREEILGHFPFASAFQLPSGCIREIERICSAFLWSGTDLKSKRVKVIWRILSAESLWVRWVQIYLIRKGSLWSIKGTTQMGSWMWKKILKHRDRAKLFYMVDVRNGLKASFWYEKWSPMGRLIEILGKGRYIEMGIKENAKVAECINHRKKNHRFSMLNRVELEIEKIKEKLYLEEKDISLWRNAKDIYKKEFKTSETWQVVREKHQHCDWYKAIWFKHYTPKYSFILWVAMRDRLSTGSRMAQWDISANTSCSFCQDPLESIEHLFFQCSFTSLIWENLARGVLKDNFTARWSEIKRICIIFGGRGIGGGMGNKDLLTVFLLNSLKKL
ncbi:PREDICTED: uncharacterized protein LOC106344352 [Brassica oleracea var. oleracea]|uniref:uncharacterized protein LOC106344352 n=1 Tax=Brassica oleracea var. oleracea TaxID=109376 RepID=UPI0006A737C8|nr:PREDICTED: uncharacterized protein LOC106344352 [Brassica oleracea var. oleracea]